MNKKLTKKDEQTLRKESRKMKLDKVQFEAQRTQAKQAEKIRELSDMLKLATVQIERLEARNDFIDKIGSAPVNIRQIETTSSTNVATAFMVLSDGHIDETVNIKSVNGINQYNPHIAEQRIMEFYKSGMQLVKIQRSGIKIDNLVQPILGDMISGHIHEDPKQTNSMTPTRAVLFARDLIISGLTSLQKHFNRIIVPFCVGNHGQLRSGGERTLIIENNLEYILAHFLAEHFKKTNVEIIIPTGYFQWLNVYGRDIRMHHGETIRYGGGIGGVTIPLLKAIANFNTIKPAYIDIIGHIHQSLRGKNYITNGSVIGYNEFAQSIKAQYEPPSQAFFLIDKKHGLTLHTPIYL